MKKASTLITAIIAIVVLLAALGVGFSVKHFRSRRAQNEPQSQVEPQAKQPDGRAALPGGGARPRTAGLTTEERSDRQDERARMNERLSGMSEEERREFMAQRPDDRRRPGQMGGRRPGGMEMSEEERQKMRERFENMSEEERQKFREDMRQRFGGRRPGGRGGDPGDSPGERPRRSPGGEPRIREGQDNPPEN